MEDKRPLMLVDGSRPTALWNLSPSLATPVARQLSRLMREDTGTSSEFDAITYLAEVVLKYETTVALGLLAQADQTESQSLGFDIVSSDGLGIWADALPKILTAITAAAKTDFLSHTRAFTQKFTAAAIREQQILEFAQNIWAELEDAEYTFSRNRLGILQFFVALRNRTRGHGATTQSQYEAINGALLEIIEYILDSSPILREDLVRPMKLKGEGKFSCRLLRGYPTQEQSLVPSAAIQRSDLLYYQGPTGLVPIPDFLLYVREDDSCYFLNSKRKRSNDESDFLDYVTNAKRSQVVTWFQDRPQPRPQSITAGREVFDWDDTVVNNLPKVDFTTYVPRQKLEHELRQFLLGSAVNFVSLEGQGGAGKTTLALRVARQIINASADAHLQPFDFIIWFSARDIDLDDYAGPLLRKRQVTSLSACASMFCELLDDFENLDKKGNPVDEFQRLLISGGYKFLLIFDNFESFDDTATLQQFIKRNLNHPSKALMTSREDAFHGDVPIDVGGLTRTEASDLMRKAARQANCEPRLSEGIMGRIYDTTLGNPYAIKLLINEFSRAESLDTILPVAFGDDYLSALFRRSFERLEDGPAYLFLLLGLSASARHERLARLATIGRQIDYGRAKKAIAENHLIDPPDQAFDDAVYRVSWAAQQFCRKIIVGHRMQREVEQDVELLRKLSAENLASSPFSVLFDFFSNSADIGGTDLRLVERNRRITTWLREHDPISAKRFALFVSRDKAAVPQDVRDAFKRAVELVNSDSDLWLDWAWYEAKHGDAHRALDLALRAVDFTDDEMALGRAARLMLDVMAAPSFKETTSFLRRGMYTGSLIPRFERKRAELSARSLGMLAWLYLQTNDKKEALTAAREGLAKAPNDVDLANMVRKLN